MVRRGRSGRSTRKREPSDVVDTQLIDPEFDEIDEAEAELKGALGRDRGEDND